MRKPKLTGEARAFLERHWSRCVADGSLSEATVDLFTLLCRTWGMLTDLDPQARNFTLAYVALSKNFERQGIPFGITSKRRTEKPKDLASIIREGLQDEPQEGEG